MGVLLPWDLKHRSPKNLDLFPVIQAEHKAAQPLALPLRAAHSIKNRNVLAAPNDGGGASREERVRALEAENARLRALMDSSAKVADRILVSEIMSVDLDPYRHLGREAGPATPILLPAPAPG